MDNSFKWSEPERASHVLQMGLSISCPVETWLMATEGLLLCASPCTVCWILWVRPGLSPRWCTSRLQTVLRSPPPSQGYVPLLFHPWKLPCTANRMYLHVCTIPGTSAYGYIQSLLASHDHHITITLPSHDHHMTIAWPHMMCSVYRDCIMFTSTEYCYCYASHDIPWFQMNVIEENMKLYDCMTSSQKRFILDVSVDEKNNLILTLEWDRWTVWIQHLRWRNWLGTHSRIAASWRVCPTGIRQSYHKFSWLVN